MSKSVNQQRKYLNSYKVYNNINIIQQWFKINCKKYIFTIYKTIIDDFYKICISKYFILEICYKNRQIRYQKLSIKHYNLMLQIKINC